MNLNNFLGQVTWIDSCSRILFRMNCRQAAQHSVLPPGEHTKISETWLLRNPAAAEIKLGWLRLHETLLAVAPGSNNCQQSIIFTNWNSEICDPDLFCNCWQFIIKSDEIGR